MVAARALVVVDVLLEYEVAAVDDEVDDPHRPKELSHAVPQ